MRRLRRLKISLLTILSYCFVAHGASANQNIYDSSSSAKRACERWASGGEVIFMTSDRAREEGYPLGPREYETDSTYNGGENHGKAVIISLFPITLRTCRFDYDSTSYIGRQHKGIQEVTSFWPKRKDGSDWTINGKKVRLFRTWDVEGGTPTQRYPF